MPSEWTGAASVCRRRFGGGIRAFDVLSDDHVSAAGPAIVSTPVIIGIISAINDARGIPWNDHDLRTRIVNRFRVDPSAGRCGADSDGERAGRIHHHSRATGTGPGSNHSPVRAMNRGPAAGEDRYTDCQG